MNLIKNYVSIRNLWAKEELLDEDAISEKKDFALLWSLYFHADFIADNISNLRSKFLAHPPCQADRSYSPGLAYSDNIGWVLLMEILGDLRGLSTTSLAANDGNPIVGDGFEDFFLVLGDGELRFLHNWNKLIWNDSKKYAYKQFQSQKAD